MKKPEGPFVYDTYEELTLEDGQNFIEKVYAIAGLTKEEAKECEPYYLSPDEALEKLEEIKRKREAKN